MNIFRRSAVLVASVTVGALVLAGCSSSTAMESESVAVSDQWAKAAGSGMTAVFATVENTGGRDIQVVSAASPASGVVELHEVADGTMRQKEGGFTIPAGQSHTLAPGGDHIMLMGLSGPLEPGSDVEITLTLGDGSTTAFTAQARDFDGNNEEYSGDTGHGDMGHGGTGHGDMGHGGTGHGA